MIKVIVAGDICARGQEDTLDVIRAEKTLESLQPVLQDADIRIANWENPTTLCEGAPISKSGAMLHSKPANIGILSAGGFDVANMANNHTGDYGPDGVLATLKYLRRAGIATVGAGSDLSQARRPIYLERNGERLAIISACEHEFGIADEVTPGVAGYDSRIMKATIRSARQQADYVLVIFHGGNEYNPLPSPGCVARYRDIIDMGANALVGMHSHCPQGYEIYNGAPIVYGTGNFMFKTMQDALPVTASWHYGYLVELCFASDRATSLDIAPYQFNREASEIKLMQGEQCQIMLDYLSDISKRFADPAEHDSMFKGWCMIAAPGYAQATKYDDAMPDMPFDSRTLALRNVFTCQAHNELITTYMRMIVESKLDIGRKYEPIVRQLQRMPITLW